jgi:hypothetical protein
VIAAAAFFAPSLTSADSNGAPNIAGTWRGTLQSRYWDQTSSAATKPKLKFKTKVTVTIVQANDDPALAVVIAFDDDFPAADGNQLAVAALSGFIGNGHCSLSDSEPVVFTFSCDSNKNANHLKMVGVAATGDFTHELKMSLKKQKN